MAIPLRLLPRKDNPSETLADYEYAFRPIHFCPDQHNMLSQAKACGILPGMLNCAPLQPAHEPANS